MEGAETAANLDFTSVDSPDLSSDRAPDEAQVPESSTDRTSKVPEDTRPPRGGPRQRTGRRSASRPATEENGGTGNRSRGAKPEAYVRPEVTQREKLSEDALSAKMAAMKIQNAKLQAQRDAAIEDENEWARSEAEVRKAREQEQHDLREREAAKHRQQTAINEERAKVAARKLEKMKGREWDNEKDWDSKRSDWKNPVNPSSSSFESDYHQSPRQETYRGRQFRGGRSRGSSRPNQAQSTQAKALDVSSKEEFPDLASPQQQRQENPKTTAAAST